MRKMMIVASREYQAAVRTKTFVIGLLIMPLMIGGSIAVQALFKDVVDTTDKRFGLVSRVGGFELVEAFEAEVSLYNLKKIFDANGKQVKPRFLVEIIGPALDPPGDVAAQRLELSNRVRKGQLIGFLELLPPYANESDASGKKLKVPQGAQVVLHYETNRPTYGDFTQFAQSVVTEFFRKKISKKAGLSEAQAKAMVNPVVLDSKGLTTIDEKTGKIEAAKEQDGVASIIIPALLMMLMFVVILMSAAPLMQGVVEEKMQRIAEVLLGSVRPFHLMMGKLIGMTGMSLTIGLVYLGGTVWGLYLYGFAEHIPLELVFWFVIYQCLAALMFGSLFIAVGAACTDMRETQNLMLPVMLLASLPMFFIGQVLLEPNSAVARGVSFFPFATPTMMIARQAVPPGIPWWEPAVGVVLVLATTILCVYIAARIFRIGILLQGKGARFGEIIKWVFRG